MAFLSKLASFLCPPPLSKRSRKRQRKREQLRRPSFRRRTTTTTRPVQSLTVSVQQTASEWSQITSKLFETATFRPSPPLPTRVPPAPPHDASFHSRRPSQTTLMASRRTPLPRSLDEPLSPVAVADIMVSIGRAFRDMPYAVCGLAAMVHYGYGQRAPWQVSLVCPAEVQENMRCWAVATGMRRISFPSGSGNDGSNGEPSTVNNSSGRHRQHDRDVFILTTQEGTDRRIKIRFTHDFRGLHRTRTSVGAYVLTLPSLADQVALGYVQSLVQPRGGESSAQRQQLFAGDMGWLLHRMVGLPANSAHRLTAERVPHIVDRNFWLPFTLSFPGSAEAFAAAGLHFDTDDRGSYLLESDSSGSDTAAQRDKRRRRPQRPGHGSERRQTPRGSWAQTAKAAFSSMVRRLLGRFGE